MKEGDILCKSGPILCKFSHVSAYNTSGFHTGILQPGYLFPFLLQLSSPFPPNCKLLPVVELQLQKLKKTDKLFICNMQAFYSQFQKTVLSHSVCFSS